MTHINILITGIEGYIGTVLAANLIKKGHQVMGLDTGFHRSGCLYNTGQFIPPCIQKDIRLVTKEELHGYEAIIHLAELSNDPLGSILPEATKKINYWGSLKLAQMAKEAGVTKFIYSSSCSVYGMGSEIKIEKSVPIPQTAYAQCKVLVEGEVSKLADDNFSPTFLRNSTVYGPSPRMRFDLLLNNLSGQAFLTNELVLQSDGSHFRPLIHIRDVCGAISAVLEAPREKIHNQILNIGSNDQNFRVIEVAEIIARHLPGCRIKRGANDCNADSRSYRVSFDKIRELLPEFKCSTLDQGAEELLNLYKHIELDRETFESRSYTRLKQISYLRKTSQIDEDFFWRRPL